MSQSSKKDKSTNSEKYQHLLDLTKFLEKHYGKEILGQLKQKILNEIKSFSLCFDLNLMQIYYDQLPTIGKWMIDQYPSFCKTLQRSIYNVIQAMPERFYNDNQFLNDIQCDQIFCNPIFKNIPYFNTPLQQPLFKNQIIRKGTGSLLHLKNCIIISINQPEQYLGVQYFQSTCSCYSREIIQINNLIKLLKQNYNDKRQNKVRKYCPKCKYEMIEIKEKRKYLPCQEIQIFYNDLSAQNKKKYANYQQPSNLCIDLDNENAIRINQRQDKQFSIGLSSIKNNMNSRQYYISNRNYKVDKNSTYSLFITGDLVGKLKPGQEIHCVAYFSMNINNDDFKQLKIFNQYFVSIQTNFVNHLTNRLFFEQFQKLIEKNKCFGTFSQQFPEETDSKITIILYNRQYPNRTCYENTQTPQLYQRESPTLIRKMDDYSKYCRFCVQLNYPQSLIISAKNFTSFVTFLEKYRKYSILPLKGFKLQIKYRNKEIRVQKIKNIIQQNSIINQVDLNQRMHICIINEDEEYLKDTIQKLTSGVEDIFHLPYDIDETTMQSFIMNLVKGGILVVNYNLKMKRQVFDIVKQILIQGETQILNQKIKINCSVWFLVPMTELFSDKKSTQFVVTLSSNPKLHEIRNNFDIVLDITYCNNKQKQVLNDFYEDHSDQYLRKYESELSFTGRNMLEATSQKIPQRYDHSDYLQTNKKPHINGIGQKLRSVSSCHLIDGNVQLIKTIQNQHMEVLQMQNQEASGMLLKYYHKMRDEKQVEQPKHQHYLDIIVTLQYQIKMYMELYQFLTLQSSQSKEKILISYSDVFLSILLSQETRINGYDFQQALIGNTPSNFLFNSMKLTYQTPDEYSHYQYDQNTDTRYKEFRKIYTKVISFI